MDEVQKSMKRHLVGFETEFLLLEEDGRISTRADDLILLAGTANLKYPLQKECSHSMIEISSEPKAEVRKSAHGWFETMHKLIDIADKAGLRLYPYGTYFGKYKPAPRKGRYYEMKKCVLGNSRFENSACRVVGFHFHYCLPYGTFNRKTSGLKHMFNSKYKDHLLNIYNMMVSMDPAATCLMQSSPYLDGKHVGKDTRAILYRTMKYDKGADAYTGLYHGLPLFGGLPPYSSTLWDLINLVENRQKSWAVAVRKKCANFSDIVASSHPLELYWGPLRINKVGTLEYRGMDMNLPSYMIGTSLLIKYIMKRVRAENLSVQPSDAGIREPFKIEGDRLLVPPYSYVNKVLQAKSAILGFDDNEMYSYARALVKFGMKSVPNRNDPGVARIKEMIEGRKTRSDEILGIARGRHYETSDVLDEDFARGLALKGCRDFEKEVKKIVNKELIIDFEE